MKHDTIAAIATALGQGAIGIVRLSGPDSLGLLRRVFRGPSGKPPKSFPPRFARLGQIVDPATAEAIDEVLVIFFPSPRSYTAEDVVEVHGHGGPVVVQRLLEVFLRLGARPAEPGEFTLRALLNGRLDLAQAEAVADVIAAQSAAGLRSALAGLTGRLSERIRGIQRELLTALAYLTARVDFPEDDIPEQDVSHEIERVRATVQALLAEGDQGRVLRSGVRTAIVGRPNAGKSSLLNRLLGAERAIVTAVPGTTRDTIEETIVVRGVPFVLVDTAGIQPTRDAIERIGIERSRRAIESADLVVFVVDASGPATAEDQALGGLLDGAPTIYAANKADLLPAATTSRPPVLPAWLENPVAAIHLSALTGEGVDALEQAMVDAALGGRAMPSEAPLVANPRHLAALHEADRFLESAVAAQRAGLPADFVRLDVESALQSLGAITGETLGEDLLDEIFRRFCIGK